jgi:aminopeptidase C
LYKIRNDRKIKLPRKWVEVASEDMVTDNTVFYLTDVGKILGQDDGLYGYIVYSYRESAFIKIIDANTVELIFNHQVQGAP